MSQLSMHGLKISSSDRADQSGCTCSIDRHASLARRSACPPGVCRKSVRCAAPLVNQRVPFGTSSGECCSFGRSGCDLAFGAAVLSFYHRLSRERKPQVMIAAGLSNPQSVGLVRRRDLGLPLASGLTMVFRIFGHLVMTLGSSRRAPGARVLPAVASLLGITALLHVEVS